MPDRHNYIFSFLFFSANVNGKKKDTYNQLGAKAAVQA